MNYSIHELSRMAGVSTRTLRYYDEIGLLTPACLSAGGYRCYGETEVAALQQILFYRERKFNLKQIQRILTEPDFDLMSALKEHLGALESEQRRTECLIRTVKQTIASMKGDCLMNDTEKFEGFKREAVAKNEALYGSEIREKYGDDQVDASNQKFLAMSQEDLQRFQALQKEIPQRLAAAVRAGKAPESEEGREIVALHKAWLSCTQPNYSAQAHRSLASMYVADARFTAYYDKEVPGCAAFLEKAINHWAAD